MTDSVDVKNLCVEGLMTDGSHHKQWFFEQILEALGFDLNEIRAELLREGYEIEVGIIP